MNTGTTAGGAATYVHTAVQFKYIGTESSAHGNILESGKENASQHIPSLFSFSTTLCKKTGGLILHTKHQCLVAP